MIYIVAHKEFKPPIVDKAYRIIYVGEKIRQYARERQYLTDASGNEENISDKNNTFCELTALYWIYRNDFKSEYIGLNHYHRYFLSETFDKTILCESERESILQNYDIILPKVLSSKYSIRQFYCRGDGYEKDIIHLEMTVKRFTPPNMKIA